VITQPLLFGLLPLYSVILTCSAALGLVLTTWMVKERKLYYFDLGIGILFVSLLGARIGYVLQNYYYFSEHIGEIFQFWLGGLSWAGALIGAFAALVGIYLIWKEPLGKLADIYLPLIGTTTVAIWLTGWGAGIGYGLQTESWIGIPVRDMFGNLEKRWPLPILGALLSAGWISGLIWIPFKSRMDHPGIRACLGLAGLALINAILSLFRMDPAPQLWGIRWETWLSLIMLGILIGWFYKKGKLTLNGKTNS
jgi:prolipoprotein diacylglyceryltransferase